MGGTDSRGLIPRGGSRLRSFGNDDLGVILQLVKTAVGYNITRVDAGNRRLAPIRYAGLDVTDLSGVILNEIDERNLAIMLNRRGGNERDPCSVSTSNRLFTNWLG